MPEFIFRLDKTSSTGWQTWTVTATTDAAGRLLETIAVLLHASFRVSGAMIISGAQVETVKRALAAGEFSTHGAD